MDAKLTFGNVAFSQADGQVVRVKLGEIFGMELFGAPDQPLQWATSKDPVLNVSEESAVKAVIKAEKIGQSRILLMNANDNTVFRLNIDVFDTEEASGFEVPEPSIEAQP
jgi:hypothetical protein